jgi:hypothetical protein
MLIEYDQAQFQLFVALGQPPIVPSELTGSCGPSIPPQQDK